KVRVKISKYGSFEKMSPEYDDCKKIAERENIPLIEIIKEVERIAKRK
ncbi:MAG: TIGR00299 family protein, partial [Dictyoglomus turgidum]